MKKLLSVLVVICMVVGIGSVMPVSAETLTNLFDVSKAELGHYSVTGHTADGTFTSSEMIAVTDDDVMYFAAAATGQGWHVVSYDSKKAVIKTYGVGSGIDIVSTLDSSYSIMRFKVIDGAAYIRFVLETSKKSNYLVTKNQPFYAADYYSFFKLTDPNPSGHNETKEEDFEHVVNTSGPLYGKTALFVGDSICHGQWDNPDGVPTSYAYAGRIGDWYGMKVYNRAYGGTALSTIRGNNRIIKQIENAKGIKTDYVILQGGVNDAWGNTETKEVAKVGEISDSFNIEDFDISTYAGALEELICRTIELFPDAKIGYIFTFYAPLAAGIGRCGNMTYYYEEAEKICNKWGIQYLDLYHDDYFSNVVLKVNTYTYLMDALHPRGTGYDRMAPYIAKWMENMVDRETTMNNPLTSKTALFVGDSINAGSNDESKQGGWAGRIARMNGMRVINGGTTGMSISTIRGNQIYENLVSQKQHNFQYVIMQGGVNDAWDSAPVGDMIESFNKDDFDRSTFAGGLEHLFATAKELYPKATLGYIFTYQIKNATASDGRLADMEDYYAVAAKICDKWGIKYLDMYHSEKINNALYKNAKYMSDYVHPSSAGYSILSSYISTWMKTLNVEGLFGDMNDDEAITADDALEILQYAVGKIKLEGDKVILADVDGNGAVEATDALLALQKAIKKIDKFPVE